MRALTNMNFFISSLSQAWQTAEFAASDDEGDQVQREKVATGGTQASEEEDFAEDVAGAVAGELRAGDHRRSESEEEHKGVVDEVGSS